MILALRELRRRPSRFGVATGVLTLIVVLLLFLGGLTDGLFVGSVGAIRSQDAEVFVTSSSARDSFLRSRIDRELRSEVEAVDGVDRVGGLGFALLTARVEGASADDDPNDVALITYEFGSDDLPEPPAPGRAVIDERLRTDGVQIGDTLLIGPAAVPVVVDSVVKNSNYLLQDAVWVESGTWRRAVAANRPDLQLADGVFQTLVVQSQVDPAVLATRIDDATSGATSSLTKPEAELSLPGTEQQQSTFLQIIGTTLAVAALVIALFFSLLTLERTGLYGVLKALGSSSGQLFSGVALQALVVTAISLVIGGILTLGLVAIAPPEIPLLLTGGRAMFVAVGMLIASVVGSVVSLRRVVRIDPASAIGGST